MSSWGQHSTGRVFAIGLMSVTVILLLLPACSNDPVAPWELLLGPADFPGQGVTLASREIGETSLDEPAVQVELNGPDFILLESLVLFEVKSLGQSILTGIKQDQLTQDVKVFLVDGFEDNSGVIIDRLQGNDASTLFFIQGRALVRITLAGVGHEERVWEIARLARDKSAS